MNALYVARKIFRQFLRDRRTMALIFLVPVAIMTIYYFLLKDDLSMKLALAVISTERGSAPYKAFAEVLGGQKNIGFIEDPGPTAAWCERSYRPQARARWGACGTWGRRSRWSWP